LKYFCLCVCFCVFVWTCFSVCFVCFVCFVCDLFVIYFCFKMLIYSPCLVPAEPGKKIIPPLQIPIIESSLMAFYSFCVIFILVYLLVYFRWVCFQCASFLFVCLFICLFVVCLFACLFACFCYLPRKIWLDKLQTGSMVHVLSK
jgi:hypothetical protein